MSRIHPITLEQADSTTRATLESVEAKLGLIPNLLSTLALSPTALNAYLGLSDTVSKGRLSAKDREAIALAVGQANSCQYCLSAHTLIGKSVGLSEEQILQARLAVRSNIVAYLSARIVESSGLLTDSDLALARQNGLDNSLILEVLANVTLNILTNYANHIAETPIDFPPVPVEL